MKKGIDAMMMLDIGRAVVLLAMAAAACLYVYANRNIHDACVYLNEKGSDAMLVFSESERIGTGELLLEFADGVEFIGKRYADMQTGDILRIHTCGKDSFADWQVDRVEYIGEYEFEE